MSTLDFQANTMPAPRRVEPPYEPTAQELEFFTELLDDGIAAQQIQFELDGRAAALPPELEGLAQACHASAEALLDQGRVSLELTPEAGHLVLERRSAPPGQAVVEMDVTAAPPAGVELGELPRSAQALRDALGSLAARKPRLLLRTFDAT